MTQNVFLLQNLHIYFIYLYLNPCKNMQKKLASFWVFLVLNKISQIAAKINFKNLLNVYLQKVEEPINY